MKIDQKYLTHREQIKIKLLEDECLMLTNRIDRIVRKRENLMRKRAQILLVRD